MTPYRGAYTGSEPTGRRSWEVESPRMDGSYQEEEGSSSVFTSSTSWSKFLISLVSHLENYFSTFVFLLQKKCKIQFDESDDEAMVDLLEAAATPLSTTAEQSPVAKKARVESFDCVDGAHGTSLVIEATEEVGRPPLRMPAEPSGTGLLPKDGVEAMKPLL